jgi:hypothetical protein
MQGRLEQLRQLRSKAELRLHKRDRHPQADGEQLRSFESHPAIVPHHARAQIVLQQTDRSFIQISALPEHAGTLICLQCIHIKLSKLTTIREQILSRHQLCDIAVPTVAAKTRSWRFLSSLLKSSVDKELKKQLPSPVACSAMAWRPERYV